MAVLSFERERKPLAGLCAAVALTAVLCCACANDIGKQRSAARGSTLPGSHTSAIPAGGNSVMVPVGVDEVGCQQYAARPDSGAVTAAIHYRKTDGGFTMFRAKAGCSTR